jgi:hypothetical protein
MAVRSRSAWTAMELDSDDFEVAFRKLSEN